MGFQFDPFFHLLPHFFVYVERIGLRSGYRYDVGVQGSTFVKAEAMNGNFINAPGFLTRKLKTRNMIRRNGDRVAVRPSAKFTIMQFIAWERVAFYPYISGFNYCLTGTNCYSWSVMAILEAKAVSRLPLFP